MRKEQLQEFSARVTQANRSELVVIMYDMIKADVDSAKLAYEVKDYAFYEKECRHAMRVLNELMATLDYHYEMAYDLLSLYSYTNKRLVAALMKHDVSCLEEAMVVINNLRIGFEGAAKQDKTGPMMSNTQQIYAGLTYGRGTLNESELGYSDPNRGFTA